MLKLYHHLIGKNHIPKYTLLTVFIFTGILSSLHAQALKHPVPLEVFWGHYSLYYQVVVKNKFSLESKFGYFGLNTYTADYQNNMHNNSLNIIAQFNYSLVKGIGLMVGTDMNSFSGFSPIIGPQYNYASKEWLAVTILSYFLNGDSDLKLFGLYEYKPAIGKEWSLYSRFQFIINQNLQENSHNKSYIYLRFGLKRKSLIFGIASNLDWSGPKKIFQDNYGVFVRWEFR